MFRLFKKKIIDHPVSLLNYEGEIMNDELEILKRRGYELNENDLIRCISENKSKMLVYYAVCALKIYGTTKCIPTMKSLLSYPKLDVQVCSVLTIASILEEKGTSFYAELLDSNFRHKFWVMAVVWEIGDERAVNAVRSLGQKIVKNKVVTNTQSDILYITEYLEKFNGSNDSELISALKQRLPILQPW